MLPCIGNKIWQSNSQFSQFFIQILIFSLFLRNYSFAKNMSAKNAYKTSDIPELYFRECKILTEFIRTSYISHERIQIYIKQCKCFFHALKRNLNKLFTSFNILMSKCNKGIHACIHCLKYKTFLL